MISGAETCIFDFLTPAQIALVQSMSYPDVTTAITAALATGNNLYFPPGGYGHTGGLVQDDNAHKGQSVRGSGDGTNANGSGGQTNRNATIFKKLSGSATGYQFDSDFGTLQDIRFDNGGLNGICLLISCHNARAKNIVAGNMNAATTDSTVLIDGMNVSSIDTLSFFGNNYCQLDMRPVAAAYGALYSEFRNIILTDVLGSYSMILSTVEVCNFYNLVSEGTLRFNNVVRNCNFFGTTSEALPIAKRFISTSNSYQNVGNLNFFGLRINSNTADRGSVPLIDLNYTYGVEMHGVQFEDGYSAAPWFISLQAARQFMIKNASVKTVADYRFVESVSGTYYSEDIVVDNCNSLTDFPGTPYVGTNTWGYYSKSLSVSNTEMKNVLTTSTATATAIAGRVAMTNCKGRVTVLAGYTHIRMLFQNCDEVLDDDGYSYMTNCTLQNGAYVGSGKAKSTVITLAAAATYTWSGAIPVSSLVKNFACFNVTAITGALTSYNVGYTAKTNAFGAAVAKTIGTLQYSQSFIDLSPVYNEQSGADDIIFTGVGGNFATGTIRAYVVYEPLGFITS